MKQCTLTFQASTYSLVAKNILDAINSAFNSILCVVYCFLSPSRIFICSLLNSIPISLGFALNETTIVIRCLINAIGIFIGSLLNLIFRIFDEIFGSSSINTCFFLNLIAHVCRCDQVCSRSSHCCGVGEKRTLPNEADPCPTQQSCSPLASCNGKPFHNIIQFHRIQSP